MSKPYKEYKVNELKELLKERGLSASGTKSELINRLEEADAAQADDAAQPEAAEAPAAAPAEAAPAESTPEEQPAVPEKQTPAPEADATPGDAAAAGADTAAGAAVEETEAVKATEEAAPQRSDEEVLAKFKADMSAKIERTKRFGGDASDLEARLRRIEKFGISAVRDAAEKAQAHGEALHRNGRRRNKNKKRSGPKPATA